MVVEIRLATQTELPFIESCAHRAYSQYISRIGREPAPMIADFKSMIERQEVHIAMYDERFAGYIVIRNHEDNLHLENVAVFPELVGQGIGGALIRFAEQSARDQGMLAIELYTNEAMIENHAMYLKLGYEVVDRKSQNGFNRVFFRKAVL
jgi:GNAT superfamily N-acetyltransferase